ncbi:MAG TPA: ABC transporter permease [Mycobacteriales bacterium]|nr:ABC transporter permease [Mycobacteriales bacterium]
MSAFLSYSIVGLVTGCIYALTATGLVVTYTTSGIFNFAHGAIGMMAAFTYWQLTIGWGWSPWVALPAVLLVGAPLFGGLVERILIRPLRGASADLSIVITLGLLLFLIGIANLAWKPTVARVLPPFLGGMKPLTIGSLTISMNQVLIVVVALAVAVGLRLLFSQTRIGIAMRGVVDDPDLAAMAGASPARVQQLSWALGSGLAALAGILLAPLVTLNIITLTLLVINGYAAALFGRLKSLPRTAVGGLALGLVVSYAKGYFPVDGPLARIQPALPMVFLLLMLIISPPARLRTATLSGSYVPTVPGLRESLLVAAGFVAIAAFLAGNLSPAHLAIGGKAFALAIALLSLVLLTGYGGLASLCQLTFVGLGAFVMGTWGNGSLLGVLASVLVTAAVGAAVALPTLRLRGLYLALATFAFATAMDSVFFEHEIGSGGSKAVPRLHLPGIPTQSDKAFFMLCAVAFAVASIGVLAIRRGRWGRQLTALNDSPAACATLGVNTNITKLVVFSLSAGLAGLAGALFGGLRGGISPGDFTAIGSLALLLSLRIGGVSTVTGALFGALAVSLFPTLQDHVPSIPQLSYLLTGLAAVSIGRDPDGFGGQVSRLGERLRARAAGRQPEHAEGLEEAVLVHH